MKTIRFVETLDYYDGVLTFEGRGDYGVRYIGEAIPSDDEDWRYQVVPVRADRLLRWRVGALDRRSLMADAREWFIARSRVYIPLVMDLEPQGGPLPDADLPPEGDMEKRSGLDTTAVRPKRVPNAGFASSVRVRSLAMNGGCGATFGQNAPARRLSREERGYERHVARTRYGRRGGGAFERAGRGRSGAGSRAIGGRRRLPAAGAGWRLAWGYRHSRGRRGGRRRWAGAVRGFRSADAAAGYAGMVHRIA